MLFPYNAANPLLLENQQDHTPLGFEYTTSTVTPESISLIPVLRSGLGMVEGRWSAQPFFKREIIGAQADYAAPFPSLRYFSL